MLSQPRRGSFGSASQIWVRLFQQTYQCRTALFYQCHAWQSLRGHSQAGRQANNQLCLPHVACTVVWGGLLSDSRLRVRAKQMGMVAKDEEIPRRQEWKSLPSPGPVLHDGRDGHYSTCRIKFVWLWFLVLLHSGLKRNQLALFIGLNYFSVLDFWFDQGLTPFPFSCLLS